MFLEKTKSLRRITAVLHITTEAPARMELARSSEKKKQSLKQHLIEKMKTWINGLGKIELKVPRDRKGELESQWLPERKGQDPELEAFLAEAFLAGLSTRDLARISEKHLGHKYDSKQISRIVGRATTELEAWRRRSLQGQRYKFLYVDGANFLVRINGHVSRQSFCAVLGVSEENERFEVLALEMGDRERADLWASLFEDLAERGLNLETVELGIMDGLPGLEAIFQRFFPRAQTQRCQKHAQANACRRVRKQERELFSKHLNGIFYAPTQSAARAAFFALKQQWGRLFPSAVQIIEKDFDSLLTFFQFDPTYWTVLRTTNPMERLNKEFKRRTRAMEVTGGEISTYRCLAYVAQCPPSLATHPQKQPQPQKQSLVVYTEDWTQPGGELHLLVFP